LQNSQPAIRFQILKYIKNKLWKYYKIKI
jgi:hypothetical protein